MKKVMDFMGQDQMNKFWITGVKGGEEDDKKIESLKKIIEKFSNPKKDVNIQIKEGQKFLIRFNPNKTI